MRKTIVFLFLLLVFTGISFGQQPQWTVVASVVLFNQDYASLKRVTLLTPTEPGIYRLNFYFSGGGHTNNAYGYYAELRATDISGVSEYYIATLECGSEEVQILPQVILSLKPQQPVTYDVGGRTATPGCVYNLAITVEQLVQQ